MKVHNQAEYEQWQANQKDDEYGLAIFRYAEAWADLMEPKLEAGDAFDLFAAATSHQADTEGITGFMYSAAAQILAKCWVHGEPFRRWFNLHHQIGDEGERANEKGTMLNTAMLNLGPTGE
jgi:hypothetical protein